MNLMISELDLINLSHDICELEFEMNNSEDQKTFDLFMLGKIFFDALGFYYYGNLSVEKIIPIYYGVKFYSIQINKSVQLPVVNKILEFGLKIEDYLHKNNIIGKIIFVPGPPKNFEERNINEQHLKSLFWRLGAFITINLRISSSNNNVMEILFNLYTYMGKHIYGNENMETFKQNIKKIEEKYDEIFKKTPEKLAVSKTLYSVVKQDLKYTLSAIKDLI